MSSDVTYIVTTEGEPDQDTVAVYRPENDESLSTSVVRTVSTTGRTDDVQLEPLYSVVDPDALDSIFAPRQDGTLREGEGYVSFEWDPYRVRVESDGRIELYERE